MSRSVSGALGGTTPSKEEFLEKKNARTLAEKRSFLVRMVSDPKCYNPKIVRHLNMTSYRKMSEDVARDRTLRQTIGGSKLTRPKYLTSEICDRSGSEGDTANVTNASGEDEITVALQGTGLQTPITSLSLPLLLNVIVISSLNDDIALPRCRSVEEVRCDLGVQCIPKAWLCDGRLDCVDGSDERYCLHKNILPFMKSQGKHRSATLKCPYTWFFCRDASKCIHPADVCNGIIDCRDGSDEEGFCENLKQLQRHIDEPYDE